MTDMSLHSLEKKACGRLKPCLIIHGGAGAITRSNLPRSLYQRYEGSLLQCLTSTKTLLDQGASALDAACHAVSQMEDDPLFNCGRGSVFTRKGTIEMEASVMVASVNESGPPEGKIKRGAAVSLVRNTRHPIMLAKEVLLDADGDDGLGGTSTMHCHLSGIEVEESGWKKGLERKGDDWFWTRRRWEEHRRGFRKGSEKEEDGEEGTLPSQGTVGAVCMDSWGNLAVATSTGGLTNKAPGRIGDTPTIGAGFWVESWEEEISRSNSHRLFDTQQTINQMIRHIAMCVPSLIYQRHVYTNVEPVNFHGHSERAPNVPALTSRPRTCRRAVAMSGTGNGDSFLRTNAVRSAAAICRFSTSRTSLARAMKAIAGKEGELQRSAGDRWGKSGKGQGGIIGIEVSQITSGCDCGQLVVNVSFDFNCGGLWRAFYRAFYRVDPDSAEEIPVIRVFREEY